MSAYAYDGALKCSSIYIYNYNKDAFWIYEEFSERNKSLRKIDLHEIVRSKPEVAALEQRLAEAHSEHERAEQRHGDVTVHLKAQLRDLQVPRKALGKRGDSSSSFSLFWKNQSNENGSFILNLGGNIEDGLKKNGVERLRTTVSELFFVQ